MRDAVTPARFLRMNQNAIVQSNWMIEYILPKTMFEGGALLCHDFSKSHSSFFRTQNYEPIRRSNDNDRISTRLALAVNAK